MTHLHWIILAYTAKDEHGNFLNAVQIDVLANDRTIALARAAELWPGVVDLGGGYSVRNIIEHLDGACK